MNFIELKKYLVLHNSLNKDKELLEKINESDKLSIIKFYYFHKEDIHKILYELQKLIKINYDEKMNLSYYFYLSLLIRDNPDIINYSYSIQFINKLNEIQKINNDKYKKIILSKIILELIDNYKGLFEYYIKKEEKEKKIEIIKNNNLRIINDNISIFKEIGLNWNVQEIKLKKIDGIYTEIIISLIKNYKLENYEYSYDIIKQLDLELIDITNIMLVDIQNFFDNNENIIKKYLIDKYDKLLDTKNINFYFILFKYILKNNTIINNINFLKKNKKLVNDLNLDITSFFNEKNIDNNIKERLVYILKIIIDKQNNKISQKKMDNNNISINNKLKSIKDKQKEGEIEDEVKNINLNENNEKIINQSKNKNNQSTKKNSFNLESSISKSREVSYGYNNNNNNNDTYKSENSKILKKSGSLREIDSLNDLNNENQKSNSKYSNIFNNIKIIGNHLDNSENKNETKKVKYTAEFITEINKNFISGGTDNNLIIYDSSYNNKIAIKKDDWIYNVVELNNKNKYLLNFLYSSKKGINLIKIGISYKLEKNKEKLNIEKYNSNYLIDISKPTDIENNNYFLCRENQITFLVDIFSKTVPEKENNINDNILMKSGIKISDNMLVCKSNKVVSKGEDKLIFINFLSQTIIKIIKDYSFTYTTNGITIISQNNKNKKNDNNKILLFACKKYLKNQKNGILLLNIKEIKNKNKNKEYTFHKFFYDTKDFEVYCFCQVLIIRDDLIIKDENKIKYTNYFLVGGFHNIKNKGIIKLFKIIYGIDYKQNKIEYIQDIMINNKFKGPISCIIQSNTDGKILISCWDGNIYLLDKPNIEDYLKYDEKIKKKLFFILKK